MVLQGLGLPIPEVFWNFFGKFGTFLDGSYDFYDMSDMLNPIKQGFLTWKL